MKKFFFSLILLSFYHIAFSQHETDKWFFGVYSGLDFSSGVPVPISGSLYTTEGCSSISDGSGNLLFYSDGVTVWNKNHGVMPNGTGLDGDVSSTQSALIVPMPGSGNQYYYIFTVAADGGAAGFRYSVVDISLDNGLGDIITKNVSIHDFMTEKIAAELHANGNDYWIVAHEWNSNAFLAYTLTSSGLNLTPVISNVGSVHTDSVIQNTYGQMKFSTCNEKLGVAISYQNTVEIFDFDPATGVVSNPITLPIGFHVYGLEFSPDGNILYVSDYDPYHTLLQFDLTSGNANDILASEFILSNVPDIYALQLGPDGKIYACRAWSNYMAVVNDPNEAGGNCNYDDNGLSLDPNYLGLISSLGLPGFMQSFLRGKSNCIPTNVNESEESQIEIYPNPSADNFTLSLSTFDKHSEITIYDSQGRTVESISHFSATENFSFGKNYPAGLYLVSIQSGIGLRMERVIKINE